MPMVDDVCAPRTTIRAVACSAAAVAMLACRSTPTVDLTPPVAIDVSDPPEARVTTEAGAPAAEPEAVETLAFLPDGTLVAAGTRTLLARAPDGAVERRPLAGGTTVHVSSVLEGVVLATGDAVSMLATPSLAVVHKGKGAAIFSAPSAVVLEDERAVLTVRVGKLVRLALPAEPADGRVETVVALAGGARFNVTVVADTGPRFTGFLYDAESGALVGKGIPLPAIPMEAPPGAHVRDVGFAVDERRVVRVDLRTGKVLRQAKIACPKDLDLGNPTPSPTGELLLVTCGGDGVVLDGVTLAERRRIKQIVPGCDNGPVLGGQILGDGRTLLVQGCGGEAKLDLASGKYNCGDDPGLLGAPYDVAGGAAPAPRKALPGRERVPRCWPADKGGQFSSLGTSGNLRLFHGERLTVEHPGGSVALEEDAGYPVAAVDEGSVAYARGGRIVVRRLADGKVGADLPLAAP